VAERKTDIRMKLDETTVQIITIALRRMYNSGEYTERQGELLTYSLSRFTSAIGDFNHDRRAAGLPPLDTEV